MEEELDSWREIIAENKTHQVAKKMEIYGIHYVLMGFMLLDVAYANQIALTG